MKLYRNSDKNKLQHHIWIYRQRKEDIRKRYGIVNGMTAPEEYTHAVFNINRKIRSWKHMIRDIDKNNNKLMAVANYLALFYGVNVKNCAKNTAPLYRKARCLYSKYMLEEGVSATLIAEYMGISRGDSVARLRMKFTKGFTKNKSDRELYHRFLNYMKNIKNEQPEH